MWSVLTVVLFCRGFFSIFWSFGSQRFYKSHRLNYAINTDKLVFNNSADSLIFPRKHIKCCLNHPLFFPLTFIDIHRLHASLLQLFISNLLLMRQCSYCCAGSFHLPPHVFISHPNCSLLGFAASQFIITLIFYASFCKQPPTISEFTSKSCYLFLHWCFK